MKKIIVILIVSIIFTSCKTEGKSKETSTVEKTTEIKIESINYDGLELLLNKNDNKTYVINFWATWCKPCVEELPAFEQLQKNYDNKNVEVILVSLDFPNQLESRLIPFVMQHKIKSQVVLMVDADSNTWIPKVDKNWSGAIPATLIYNKNMRQFYEQSFTYKSLDSILSNFLKTP